MGCGVCSSGTCGTGCSKNGGCITGGCNKLNAYNWLADWVDVTTDSFVPIQVRFKGTRKEFFNKPVGLTLFTGDPIIVEIAGGGLDLGHVAMQGPLVQLQIKKAGIPVDTVFTNVIRKADAVDLKKFEEAKLKELPAMYRTRQIIQELKLEMKLSDIEFQWDLKKATFFYSAEERVDFRELIKILASEFKTRIEMKQISLRQEAARLGGIGVCGRELCCSTWLKDFKNVTTTAARYQNLAINTQKLSGQCGRLKCCLNFELDTYIEAIKDIPEVNTPIQTLKGEAILQKTDIFRKIMWFSYGSETDWKPVSTVDVEKLLALNKSGIIPESLDLNSLGEKKDINRNNELQQLDQRLKQKKK